MLPKRPVKIMRKNPPEFLPSAAAPLEMELVADGGTGDIAWLVATAALLAVAGTTPGADGPGTTVALANNGRGATGKTVIEDKKAEAADSAAEAAGGRIGATAVPPTTWAIAADASDKATEACWIADSWGATLQDAGKEVTVTVTVSF